MPVYYADTSALVKLVRTERESAALRGFLGDSELMSSELVLTELPRAIRGIAAADSSLSLSEQLEQVARVLDEVGLRSLDAFVLAGAGALTEPMLRSLDAIHVTTAIDLYPVDAFITYDKRQSSVARMAGLPTVAPGA